MKVIITIESDESTGQINTKLERIENRLMAVDDKLNEMAAKFEAATTLIAQRIQTLIDEDGSIKPETQARFDTIISALEELGKDPSANPQEVVQRKVK